MKKDRRSNQRYTMKLPVNVELLTQGSQDIHIESVTSDISSGGTFIETPRPFPLGTDVTLNVVLENCNGADAHNDPHKEERNGVRFKCAGSVIRTTKSGMAVAFEEGARIEPLETGES